MLRFLQVSSTIISFSSTSCCVALNLKRDNSTKEIDRKSPEDSESGTVTIRVIDLAGKTVKEKNYDATSLKSQEIKVQQLRDDLNLPYRQKIKATDEHKKMNARIPETAGSFILGNRLASNDKLLQNEQLLSEFISNTNSNTLDLTLVKVVQDPIPDSKRLRGCVNVMTGEDEIEKQAVEKIIGPMEEWNTSLIDDMACLFENKLNFDVDISLWDVSNVKNMASMFNGANDFNSDISDWDVSSVKDVSSMFAGTVKFDQNLGKWEEKTRNLKNLSGMFKDAKAFDKDISTWNLSNAENMSEMFSGTMKFNQDISSWMKFFKDKRGLDMSRMFYSAKKFQHGEKWIDWIEGLTERSVHKIDYMFMSGTNSDSSFNLESDRDTAENLSSKVSDDSTDEGKDSNGETTLPIGCTDEGEESDWETTLPIGSFIMPNGESDGDS